MKRGHQTTDWCSAHRQQFRKQKKKEGYQTQNPPHSVQHGGIGGTIDESEHDWALFEQGVKQQSLPTIACKFGRLVGPGGVARVFLPLPLVAMPFPEVSTSGTTLAACVMPYWSNAGVGSMLPLYLGVKEWRPASDGLSSSVIGGH